MDGSADLQTGFNLVLCYYATGEKERMKKGFSRLLSTRQLGMDDDALEADIDDVLQARRPALLRQRPTRAPAQHRQHGR